MFKSKVIVNNNKIKIPKFDNKIIILVSLFLCGVIIGVFTYLNASSELSGFLAEIFKNVVTTRKNYNILNCFISSLSVFIIIPIIIALLGLSSIGTPFIVFTSPIMGFISSLFLTFIIKSYSVKGFGYIVMIILPSLAIAIGATILLSVTSIEMSLYILSKLYDKKTEKTMTVKYYCIENSKYLGTIIVSAMLNSVSFKLFEDMISIFG